MSKVDIVDESFTQPNLIFYVEFVSNILAYVRDI